LVKRRKKFEFGLTMKFLQRLNEAKVNLKSFQQSGTADDANMANPSFYVCVFYDANFQSSQSQVSGNFPLGKNYFLQNDQKYFWSF